MSQTHKLLGRSMPAAVTPATLYTAPASTTTIVYSIVVCNSNAAADTFRIFFVPSGGSLNVNNALYYDIPIPGNNSLTLNIGQDLMTGDFIRIYSTNGYLTFTASGLEIV